MENRAVIFVDRAVSELPTVELARNDFQPNHDLDSRFTYPREESEVKSAVGLEKKASIPSQSISTTKPTVRENRCYLKLY